MLNLIISGLLLSGLLFWIAPRIQRWRENRPPDEFADEFKGDIIDRVRLEQRKASSIWRASFTEKAFPYFLGMLAFYVMFVALDATFAYFKGGWWVGIVFFMVLFVTIDSLQVIAVSSSDSGDGGALTKRRNIFVWTLVVSGFFLNVYLSQVGYGLFHNLVATKTQNTARQVSGQISGAAALRKELNKLEARRAGGSLRKTNVVTAALNGLLLQEPFPQSGCMLENKSKYGRWSRQNCGTVTQLRQELVDARRLDELRAKVPQLERENADLGIVATDSDPTAGYLANIANQMGWTVDKLTISELIIRAILIIFSALFPVILFLWSDRAHEEKERIEFELREKTDRILAKHNLIQDGTGHIRPITSEDGAVTIDNSEEIAALTAKTEERLAGLQDAIAQTKRPETHITFQGGNINQEVMQRVLVVLDSLTSNTKYAAPDLYDKYLAAGGKMTRPVFNQYLAYAAAARPEIDIDESLNVTIAA